MFTAVLFSLISVYDFSLGYSASLSKNDNSAVNRTLLTGRQDFFHFGPGFEWVSWSDWRLGVRPEVLFQHSLVGFQTWLEIEREVEIGPRHDALFILFGAQHGVHASWILDTSDVEEATSGSRSTYAVGAGLFFGPLVELSQSYHLCLRFETQLFWGRIARRSFQAAWGSSWGLVGGLTLELGFSPTEERNFLPEF